MNSRLETLLVGGLVSAEALARAQRVQRTSGGALDTALLELDVIDEPALALALARAAGLPPAPLAILAFPDPHLRKVLPGRLAERHRVAPFRLVDGELVVLASWPVDVAALAELADLRGVQVSPHAAPELWVKELQHQVYGTPLPARLVKLAQALAARAQSALDGEPRRAPQPAAARPVRPATRPRSAAPPPPLASPPPPRTAPPPRAPEPAVAALTAWTAEAVNALRLASTSDEVVHAALYAATQRFALAAFLAVGRERVFCVGAAGSDAAATTRLRRFAAPFRTDGVLGHVAAGGPAYVGAIGADEPLVAALGRAARAAIVQPVRVAGRVAGLLYVEDLVGVEPARAASIMVLAGAAGAALEQILRERIRAAPAASPVASPVTS